MNLISKKSLAVCYNEKESRPLEDNYYMPYAKTNKSSRHNNIISVSTSTKAQTPSPAEIDGRFYSISQGDLVLHHYDELYDCFVYLLPKARSGTAAAFEYYDELEKFRVVITGMLDEVDNRKEEAYKRACMGIQHPISDPYPPSSNPYPPSTRWYTYPPSTPYPPSTESLRKDTPLMTPTHNTTKGNDVLSYPLAAPLVSVHGRLGSSRAKRPPQPEDIEEEEAIESPKKISKRKPRPGILKPDIIEERMVKKEKGRGGKKKDKKKERDRLGETSFHSCEGLIQSPRPYVPQIYSSGDGSGSGC